MEVNRLNREEILYELVVRGYSNIEALTVAAMRKKLRADMQDENFGEVVTHASYQPDIAHEINVCNTKIIELETYINRTSIKTESNEYSYAETKLQHLYKRLARLKPGEADVSLTNSIKNLVDQLGEIEQKLDEQTFRLDNSPIPTTNPTCSTSVAPNQPSNSGNFYNHNFVPVYKWGIHFSGDANDKEGLSVNAFVERVNEYREARAVSEDVLIKSLCELLTGSAKLWYNSIKFKICSWSHFVKLLKEEFLTSDYDYELINAIREHYQRQDERVGSYFACMLNLFNRLCHPPSEEDKLCILRRTIDPYYIHRLGLETINTVDDLLSACKKLEAARNLISQTSRPSGDRIAILEPDLAAPGPSRVRSVPSNNYASRRSNVQRVDSIVCWNCNEVGHSFTVCAKARERKFCFRCGKDNVTKYSCTCFQGNGERGHRQNAGRRSTPENQ